MPQMDILTFSSQNIWLLVAFVIVFSCISGPVVTFTHKFLTFIQKVSNTPFDNELLLLKKKSFKWNFLN